MQEKGPYPNHVTFVSVLIDARGYYHNLLSNATLVSKNAMLWCYDSKILYCSHSRTFVMIKIRYYLLLFNMNTMQNCYWLFVQNLTYLKWFFLLTGNFVYGLVWDLFVWCKTKDSLIGYKLLLPPMTFTLSWIFVKAHFEICFCYKSKDSLIGHTLLLLPMTFTLG